MATLRLSQSLVAAGTHRVDLSLLGADELAAPTAAAVQFQFDLSAEDRERIRWYLEDYLEYPLDPAPALAAGVEARLDELGVELFNAVFADRPAQNLWARLMEYLPQLRVEIVSDTAAATGLPWELLRDSAMGTPLALQAASFVRTHLSPSVPVHLPSLEAGSRLRVLLVICRPGGRNDVAFRSVARQLVGLGGLARDQLDLDVLRPPTFARLNAVLEAAAAAGRPYQVVHFDGHGTYTELNQPSGGCGGGFSPYRYHQSGRHGYLLFEDPDTPDNQQLIGGPQMGALLVRTRVPVLVLNACRSAYAEAPDQPQTSDASDDVHSRIRAYGSLALELADAGVPGVVAMRYSVYVVTAAQFVTNLYTCLLAGQSLGTAVSASRRQLAAQPNRSIAFDPVPLQDWSVPIVYETLPLCLFNPPQNAPAEIIIPKQNPTHADATDQLPRPDVGFFGRDETLLGLDRAFDTHRAVLLHAFAGAGKTSTAAEFARWYTTTGGLTGRDGHPGLVVWSTFETYLPLPGLLNQLADTFVGLLEANGIAWLVLDDRERRQIAIQITSQIPLLWVWDNIEPVAGFPTGTPSTWTSAEEDDLLGFLRDLTRTQAKVLLTSRRPEYGWLGDLPARIVLPVMPMRERIQLTQALATRHGHRITEVGDWRPLLRYTDGNPLTITVLVGQALRDHLTSRTQIEDFVTRLRAGEADITDDAALGRTASLAASLAYGFEHAFTDTQRAQLAVLHLFQNTVDVNALVGMGHPANPSQVAQLVGLTREVGLALLDRSAEIGFLTAIGGGYYRIHPALPWFFTHLHTSIYGPPDHPDEERVTHAYTTTIASLGNYLHNAYGSGHVAVFNALSVEEANLLHARALARRRGRWDDVVGCMQGLRKFYEHVGRPAEWARLVVELVPDLVDPTTQGPAPGRDDQWSLLTEYRVGLALNARDYTAAHQLQTQLVAWIRDRVAAALATAPEDLTAVVRNDIRTLAVGLEALGTILRDQHSPDCVAAYHEAIDLARRINDRIEEGSIAFNLGSVYLTIPHLCDLDQAETWYRRSLELTEEHDGLRRAKTTSQLGRLAHERFRDARVAGQSAEILLEHLNTAAHAYHQALALTPADHPDRGIISGQLGNIYGDAGRIDAALHDYQTAIRAFEDAGDRYNSGHTRSNVAILLGRAGRTTEALLFAHAAVRDYQTLGPAAATEIDQTHQLINLLEASN